MMQHFSKRSSPPAPQTQLLVQSSRPPTSARYQNQPYSLHLVPIYSLAGHQMASDCHQAFEDRRLTPKDTTAAAAADASCYPASQTPKGEEMPLHVGQTPATSNYDSQEFGHPGLEDHFTQSPRMLPPPQNLPNYLTSPTASAAATGIHLSQQHHQQSSSISDHYYAYPAGQNATSGDSSGGLNYVGVGETNVNRSSGKSEIGVGVPPAALFQVYANVSAGETAGRLHIPSSSYQGGDEYATAALPPTTGPPPPPPLALPLDDLPQKLGAQGACFDPEGYRQMLGTMMHLVPSSAQLRQAGSKDGDFRSYGQPRGLSLPSSSSGSRSRTKVNDVTSMKEKTPCDICGDVSAGFHCNAYVCEACKKFFIRSSKNENYAKYSCSKVNACEVNKDTRTHCQRCRYQKCLRIGMVLPGAAVCPANDISIIPCRVCGAQSSGFHFGAITCEGCKGFFRRTISERDNQRYTCRNGGTCLITLATRNNCKSCRYRKCLSVGMSKDGSRIGRQPNAVKHMCAMEIERIRAKTNTPTSPNGQLYGDQVLHHQHLQTPRIDFPSNTSSYPPSGRLGPMKTEQQNHEIHLTAQEGGSRQTARLQNIIPNRMSAFSLHSQNVSWAGFAFPSAELKAEQTKPVPMEAEDYMHCDKEAQPARQGQPSAHFSDPNSSQGVKLEAQAAALGLNPLQSQCIDKFANRLREGYDTEKHQCPGDEDIGIIGRANYAGDKKSADSERASRMSNLSLAKFAKLAELAKGMPPYQRTQEFPGDFLSQRDGHAGYIYGEEAPTRCDPVGFGANCQRPVTSSCHHDSRHRIDLETGEGFTVGGAAAGEGERVEGDVTRSEVSVGVNYLSPPRSLLGRYEVTFGLRLRTGSDTSDSAPRYRQPEAPTDSGQSSSEEFIANSDKMVEEVEARFGRSGTYLDSTSDRRGSSPINNYEQEAISSLIRLAKRVDSASDSGTAEGIARLEMNAATSVGIQETGSSALYMTRPSSEPSERRLLERIKSEATDGSESQTCGGRSRGLSDSSPEEGNKFLQNYRDLVASAVAVVGHDAGPTPGSDHPTDKEEMCEGDERRREEVSESRETGERDPSAQMSSDYGAARTVFSGSFSPGVYPSAAATDFSVKFTATNPQPSQIALPQNGGYSSAASTPCYSFTSQMPLKVFTEQVVQAASNLHDCRRRVTTNFLLEPELSASVVWAYMMAQFEAHAHQVIRFARAIPGFRDLPRSDTKVLVQESMYPIVLIQMSRDFNATSMEYNFFNFTPRERRYILTEFPIMRKVAAQLRDAGTFLRPKNMDENEIALLCCIVFLQHFNRNLIESDRIYEMRAHAVSALRTYITVQYSTEERFYSLMEVLPILTNMNSSHRCIVKELMQTRQDLHFPDLYIQMFRLDDSTELEANSRSEGPAALAPGTTLTSGEAEMIGSGN